MKKQARGFSLAEAVVAMAVILIVSASVLSMVLSTAKAQARELEHHRATAALGDILTVYRISDDESTFKENLAFALKIDGEPDLTEEIPLAEGYTARIAYTDEALTVAVPQRESMGYTFYKQKEVSQ